MVEGTGLENRHTGNGIESSNLSLSVLVEIAEKTELAEKNRKTEKQKNRKTEKQKNRKQKPEAQAKDRRIRTGGRVV